jgi:hypothetical protein
MSFATSLSTTDFIRLPSSFLRVPPDFDTAPAFGILKHTRRVAAITAAKRKPYRASYGR